MPDLPGATPHLTECPICGKIGEETVFLGLHDFYEICPRCGIRAYGGFEKGENGTRVCPACDKEFRTAERARIQEKDTVIRACRTCLAEMEGEEKRQQEIVEAGGIYWRCTTCGRHGVIMPDAEIAKDFRSLTQEGKYNVPGPDGKYPPCGVDFCGSDECPGCNRDHPCHKETTKWAKE
jgi:hypothetical protein